MTPRIRPVALCIFHHDGKILVNEFHDPIKSQSLFRPMGGGIEFGETIREAIVREVREELGVDIADLRLLGTMDNIFTYLGKPGHEIVQVFDARLVDTALYERERLEGVEGDGTAFSLRWYGRERFDSKTPLVPDGLCGMLEGLGLLR